MHGDNYMYVEAVQVNYRKVIQLTLYVRRGGLEKNKVPVSFSPG